MAKGRILAIDDEEFFRSLYRDLLAAEGYMVRTAATGGEALQCLREEDFDLVVTDLEMPGMDGLALAGQIRGFNPEQEIMVVTGHQDVNLAVEAMKRGVSEYLLKPVNPEEFLLVVNRVLFRQSLGVEHRKLLDENLEFAAMLAYYRRCLAFLKVHELDRLGDLVLDTLMDLLSAEGAVLWLTGYGGQTYRLRCRRGLARIPAVEETLQPDAGQRQLILKGRAFLGAGEGTIWLPLPAGNEPVGIVRIEAPAGRESFNRRDLKVADLVGEFAAGALHAVVQYRKLEQDSLRVPRREAYTMAYFRDHIAKELHKGRRYGRRLSLVQLQVENYEELRSRFRDQALDEALAGVIATVNTALRDADIMAMDGPGEYYIMLPETDYWGSLVTQKRIRKALRGRLTLSDLKKARPIDVLMRSASYPADGTTFEELRHATRRRLERLRGSLILRQGLRDADFWEVVDSLLGPPGALRPRAGGGLELTADQAALEASRAGRYVRLPEVRFGEITRALCREVLESGRVRGVIYRGCADFEAVRRSLRHPEALEKTATSVFLLGGQRRVHWQTQRLVPIHVADEAFRRTPFLLYLNEDYAYALFARRHGEELVGFHTADFYFVENMIARLQEQYRLQAQI